jgi:hypothetical protein
LLGVTAPWQTDDEQDETPICLFCP